MSIHKNPFSLLKKTKSLINRRFPGFGPNKKQEIVRLLFEISKRDKISPGQVLADVGLANFHAAKAHLLRKRYPVAYSSKANVVVYLSRLSLKPQNTSRIKGAQFYPKQILVEKDIERSSLVGRFKKQFPKTKVSCIKSLKTYLKNHKRIPISDYSRRRNTVFITEERYDLFKKCPCTKSAVRCGYHIFNLGFGCIFNCTYCYLQEYSNAPGIILPANLNRFFDNFTLYRQKGMRTGASPSFRVGTGEFSDSLMLDDITQYSIPIVNFFKNHKDVLFEFKTKSKNINNLLNLKHAGNIIVSWSLNPQNVINENEFFTASLNQRLNSALKCVHAGYKVGLHFDPIFYYKNWHKDYSKLIDKLFLNIKPKDIAWISLGTFRFTPSLKDIIEGRFPENKILNEELIVGYDQKLRYTDKLRYEIYQTILKIFQKHKKNLPIYLCMEEKSLWQKLNLSFPF